jgi:hypothetical protein
MHTELSGLKNAGEAMLIRMVTQPGNNNMANCVCVVGLLGEFTWRELQPQRFKVRKMHVQ